MRILHLASWFPSRVWPHHGNFVFKHIRLLADATEHRVLAIQDDPAMAANTYKLQAYEQAGVHIIQVYYGQTQEMPQWQKVIYRYRAYRRGLRHLQADWANQKPDLIHAHILLDAGMLGALLGKYWHRPLLISEHSSVYHQAAALPGLRGWLGRWASRQAAALLPVTQHLERMMQEKNGLQGHYQVFSNVVDEQLFSYCPPPSREVIQLLHISNFYEPAKNLRGLIRAYLAAAEQCEQPLHLRIAGDGDRAALAQYLREQGIGSEQISLSGPHSEAEVAELIQAHHIFLLFSNYENQPVVLLEAQCCGRPCLATRVGGIADILTAPDLGRLVEAGDEAAFSHELLILIRDLPQIDGKKISAMAQQRYGQRALKAQLQELYFKLSGSDEARTT